MKIELKNISFKYTDDEEVISNVSLIVNSGEMVAIIGHNGSGKSTIAKVMVGLLEPQEGEIFINDELLTDENISMLREKVGIIFQNPDNQFVGVTVKDDIAFGLENHRIPRDEMIERINKYSKLVGMHQYLDANPEKLSGGQKQRVAIAAAIAMETEIIVFDEATSMLDPQGTKEIINMMKLIKASSNKTLITITHNLEEVLFADRVIVLNKGEIAIEGKPQDVLTCDDILKKCGLELIESLKVIKWLEKSSISNRKEMIDLLWQLTFEI